jgi:hypothetical protein
MKFPALLSLALAPPLAQFPPPGNEWAAPLAGDARSPCPFINTLANHGLINRNGKDVDLFDMVSVLSKTFDVAPTLFELLANGAIGLNFTTVDENGTVIMDIDVLFAHNTQEHDASFVRVDEYFDALGSRLPDSHLVANLINTNPSRPSTRPSMYRPGPKTTST